MESKDYDWDAASFFEKQVAGNRLAQRTGFSVCRVSGLDGFEEALAKMQSAQALVCVNDLGQGFTELSPSPRTRRVKTVYLAMRHPVDDMVARARAMGVMRELFRQLMSVLMLEKTRLEQHFLYVDPRISFTEISEYFFSGCACACFTVSVDSMTDLRYCADEWDG